MLSDSSMLSTSTSDIPKISENTALHNTNVTWFISFRLIYESLVYCTECRGRYGRRQNKLCVPFRLNAPSYFLPTEKKRKRNGTEQNGTCEKMERTKCVDLNVFDQSTERFSWLDIRL